jgi:hypothetical protein
LRERVAARFRLGEEKDRVEGRAVERRCIVGRGDARDARAFASDAQALRVDRGDVLAYMSGGLSRHYPHFSSALSPSFCSILSAHLFVPTLMPVEHGAQDRSRTARWRRPKGLSLNDRAPCYD